ncbi:MAG: DUF4388 domain-containing protein [Calditrichae bacterium]|nr:DUF4388 domain-containing protein [Calditrichia bacterium]
MRDILIYLLNNEYAEEIRYLFSGHQYQVTIIENLDDVLQACQQDLFDLALVWPASREATGQFIDLLQQNGFQYVPVVAMVDENEPLEPLYDLPLVELIRLPVSKQQFYQIIEQIVQDVEVQSTVVEGVNWQGSVEEYGLIDLIQMLENNGRDAELTLSYTDKSGKVYFREGKLINAQFLTLQGLPALKKMLSWPRGHFQTKQVELESQTDEIGLSNQEILMILVEKLLKQEQLFEGLPDLFEEIIKNPLTQVEGELPPLQHRILNYCETPITVFDLLISLRDSNIDIMLELKIMLQQSLIGRKSEVEAMVREAESQSGFGKFISSLSSMFKKKEDEEESYPYQYQDGNGEHSAPRLEVNPVQLHRQELEKIEQKLEGLS